MKYIKLILSIISAITAILGLTGYIENGISFSLIGLGILDLINAWENYKEGRTKEGIFMLICGIVVVGISIYIILFK